MSSPTNTWSDRRGMFQKGKEVHTPSEPGARRFSETGSISAAARRMSASSGSASPDKASFPTSGGSSGRRRSSAASNGLFGNLMTQKRSGEGYGARRASQAEMNQQGGMVSGWFNTTFKGYQKPMAGDDQQKTERKGVME